MLAPTNNVKEKPTMLSFLASWLSQNRFFSLLFLSFHFSSFVTLAHTNKHDVIFLSFSLSLSRYRITNSIPSLNRQSEPAEHIAVASSENLRSHKRAGRQTDRQAGKQAGADKQTHTRAGCLSCVAQAGRLCVFERQIEIGIERERERERGAFCARSLLCSWFLPNNGLQ